MTEEEMREMFGNEDPFSDFFRTFFGGGGGARRGGPRGRGGRAPRTQQGRDIEHGGRADARGGVPRRDAPDLDQHGGHARTVDVRIPAGVKDGSRVRAAGEGEPGANGGAGRRPVPARARFGRTPVFERKGDDLYTQGRACRSRPRCSAAKRRCRRSPDRSG